MDGPFRAEMLAVWLIRAFVADLAEHMAACAAVRAPRGSTPALRRALGIGNATGLGMAPFLVNHPDLLNNWIAARETAIARVRSCPMRPRGTVDAFAARARHGTGGGLGLAQQRPRADGAWDGCAVTWPACLIAWPAARWQGLAHGTRSGAGPRTALSLEGQEICAALMLEPHGALVDDLAETWAPTNSPASDRRDHAAVALRNLLREGFRLGARDADFAEAEAAGAVLVRLRGQAGAAPRRAP
jgi:hypothetical protein